MPSNPIEESTPGDLYVRINEDLRTDSLDDLVNELDTIVERAAGGGDTPGTDESSLAEPVAGAQPAAKAVTPEVTSPAPGSQQSVPAFTLIDDIKPEAEQELSWVDYLEFFAGPLMSFGDAALAPIVADYKSTTTLGKAGEAFQIAGRTFYERMFPELKPGADISTTGGLDPGEKFVERYTPNAPDALKPVIATGVSIITDPTIALGLPAMKAFQRGARAAQQATAQEGVWSAGFKDLMGVLNVTDVPFSASRRTFLKGSAALGGAAAIGGGSYVGLKKVMGALDQPLKVAIKNIPMSPMARQKVNFAFLKTLSGIEAFTNSRGENYAQLVERYGKDIADEITTIGRRWTDSSGKYVIKNEDEFLQFAQDLNLHKPLRWLESQGVIGDAQTWLKQYYKIQAKGKKAADAPDDLVTAIEEILYGDMSRKIDDVYIQHKNGITPDTLMGDNWGWYSQNNDFIRPIMDSMGVQEKHVDGYFASGDWLTTSMDMHHQWVDLMEERYQFRNVIHNLSMERTRPWMTEFWPKTMYRHIDEPAKVETLINLFKQKGLLDESYNVMRFNKPEHYHQTGRLVGMLDEKLIKRSSEIADLSLEKFKETRKQLEGIPGELGKDFKALTDKEIYGLFRAIGSAHGSVNIYDEPVNWFRSLTNNKHISRRAIHRMVDDSMDELSANIDSWVGRIHRTGTIDGLSRHDLAKQDYATWSHYGPKEMESYIKQFRAKQHELVERFYTREDFGLEEMLAQQGESRIAHRLVESLEQSTPLAHDPKLVDTIVDKGIQRMSQEQIDAIHKEGLKRLPIAVRDELHKNGMRLRELSSDRVGRAIRRSVEKRATKRVPQGQRGAINLGPKGTKSKNIRAVEELAKRADAGDKEALKQLNSILGENFAGAARLADSADIQNTMKLIDQEIGAPDQPLIRSMTGVEPRSEIIRRSVSANDTVYSKVGQINYNNINSVEDVDAYITAFKQAYMGPPERPGVNPILRILRSMTGRESPATTKILAASDKVIQSEQNGLLRDLIGRSVPEYGAEEAYLNRQILLDMGERIKKLSTEILNPMSHTPVKEYALNKAIYINKVMLERISGVTPNASRDALHSLRLVSTEPAARYAEFNRLFPNIRENRKVQRIFSELARESTAEGVTRMTEAMFKARPLDALFEVFVNNILSAIKTHTINITSNTYTLLMRPSEKFLEGMSAAARLDFQKASVDMRQFGAQLAGIMEGLTDIVKLSGIFGDHKVLIPEELTRLSEMHRMRHIPKITAEAWNLTGPMGAFVDYAGKTIRFPGTALLKEDIGFKLLHYRMAVNEDAVAKAMAKGTSPSEVQTLYNILRKHPGESVKSHAIDIANYYTFTNSLGTLGKSVLKARTNAPGLRYIIPFFQTPTNIVKFGVRHSVFGNIYKDLRHSHRLNAAGDIARAKIAMGTFIPALILSQLDENVTGAGDIHTPMGRFMEENGRPEYSIRNTETGKWISYKAIEPLRTVLGLATSVKEAIMHMDPEAEGYTEQVQEIVGAMAAPFMKVATDNYLLPQLKDLFYGLEAVRKGDMRFAEKHFARIGSAIVIPNIVSSANKALFDPTFRRAETFMEVIKSKIPGLSRSLPGYHNLWGDEAGMPDSFGPDIISPFHVRPGSEDEVDKEIIKVHRNIGINVPYEVKQIQGIELSSRQKANFQIAVGKGIPQEGLPPLKDTIREVLNDANIERLGDEAKAQLIEYQINNRRNTISQWMLLNDPDLANKYEEKQKLDAEIWSPQQ